jgi:predicted aconitase with swiveling domain
VTVFHAEVLLSGPAVAASALALTAPISFWGGVDPKTGVIADTRHPQSGKSIAGRVLLVPGTVGSSSAAAILLELVHAGLAPAAVVLHEPDAILLLGLIVAKEMGLKTPIALRLDRGAFESLDRQQLEISEEGAVMVLQMPEVPDVPKASF